MGSSRYPGKMVEDIAGKTLLERVLMRLERAAGGPQILAIPDTDDNLPLKKIARERDWKVFRGSETDVLARYAGVVRFLGLKTFVRATGDNPLVDFDVVRRIAAAVPIVSCAKCTGYPKGGAVSSATAKALLIADKEARDPYDREHVMPFIFRDPERFPVEILHPPAELRSDCRLTVDTAEDIERTRDIFREFGDWPDLPEVIRYLEGK